MPKTPAELDREIAASLSGGDLHMDEGLTAFLARSGFHRRDTGAVRVKLVDDKEATVFIHERTNGKVVIARQYSFGTDRKVYKDRARMLKALLEIRY
jgi:ribosomal protein S1